MTTKEVIITIVDITERLKTVIKWCNYFENILKNIFKMCR